MSEDLARLTARELRPFLEAQLAPMMPGVMVEELSRIKGGYSREMWSFVGQTPVARRPLILCADSAIGVVGSGEQALTRPREAALLHALHELALPVPDALCSGDARSAIGRDFLVMERKSGTAVIGPLSRDSWYAARRRDLAGQLAMMLAGIHSADLDENVLGPRPAREAVADRALAQWSAELHATPEAQTPLLDRALGWLAGNLPPAPVRVTLVHGDFRTGNILHGHGDPDEPDGFRTVLDWEMAHFGDPLEDLAWAQLACWRVGTSRVGALVELPEWVELYAGATGQSVDIDALRWWEVFGSVKMSCLLKRAAAVTTADERALLERLFDDLATELANTLLPSQAATT
jgi:aminoglycoside phosphotransferase (APT) family kinase protein